MYAKNAFWTAYYSHGAAFQKQGKFRAAIRNFENAMICDDGCHATYYQLEASKKAEELEVAKREAAKQELQQQQELLKARQARKKLARRDRNRIKKARGPGYTIGIES